MKRSWPHKSKLKRKGTTYVANNNADTDAEQPEPVNQKVEEFVTKITAAWNKQVESIIEVGRLLIKAKKDLDEHGEWANMMKRLPFSADTAQKLMAIARHPIVSNPAHVRFLPPYWSTLYAITKLPDQEILAMIGDKRINAAVERQEVEKMANEIARNGLYQFARLAQAFKVQAEYCEKWPDGNLPDDAFEDVEEDAVNLCEYVHLLPSMSSWLVMVTTAHAAYVERLKEEQEREQDEAEEEEAEPQVEPAPRGQRKSARRPALIQ